MPSYACVGLIMPEISQFASKKQEIAKSTVTGKVYIFKDIRE